MRALTGTVLFAGGGTGGHLFPGIAIAEQLASLAPDVRLRFLCSPRPGDSEMLSAEQVAGSAISFTPIPAQPFGLSPKALIKFASSWNSSVRCARDEIRRALRGDGGVVVAAMGGFVAAPVVQAARREGSSIAMVNLDASPGRANKWISRYANAVLTAAPVDEYDWEQVPPIVRRAALAPGDASVCRRELGLDPARPTLLITGASLGARSINQFAGAFVRAHGEVLRVGNWQVLHQTGKGDSQELSAIYASARIPVHIVPFLRQMGCAWGAADCAVSRAGAGSVAEAWCNRVPTIFMPYPYHADQHQRRNALPLARAGAAILVEDRIAAAENLQEAGSLLIALLTDVAKREAMRLALIALGPADGAERVARRVCSLLSVARGNARQSP